MPDNLVDNPAVFPSPVQAPGAGDPRSNTSVETPLQQLANRTANTKARVDAVVPFSAAGYSPALPAGVSSGASMLLAATNLTTLATIPAANRTDGMVCIVKDYGLYQFDAGSVLSATAPFLVAPSDVGGGAGRWVLMPNGALGVPYGLPQLDSSGRIATAIVHNGFIYTTLLQPANTNVSNSSWLAMGGPGTSTTLALQIGDIVLIDFTAAILLPAASSTSISSFAIYVTPPGGSAGLLPNAINGVENKSSAANQSLVGACKGIFVATSAGSHTFALYTSNTLPGGSASYTAMNLVLLTIRP